MTEPEPDPSDTPVAQPRPRPRPPVPTPPRSRPAAAASPDGGGPIPPIPTGVDPTGAGPASSAAPAVTSIPAATAASINSAADASHNRGFGRVEKDGAVFVRTGDSERRVGTWQSGDAAGALDFFTIRFAGLVAEIDLLDQRLQAGTIPPDEAAGAIRRLRTSLPEAPAVGDFAALDARLAGLDGLVAAAREARSAARARAQEVAHTAKLALVADAEMLAESNDWRGGVARFRSLLDSWKAQPRLDRVRDDELWHRFSAARTAYTRRRKTHFADLSAKHETARIAKEALVSQAGELAASTDWGPTAARLRSLMEEWKRVGGAARTVDDTLWKRFRAASDSFFTARNSHFAAQDSEYAGNAERKEQLLVEAERLLPVTDVTAAKTGLRGIHERWSQIGKVPRDSMRSIDARLEAVEQAVTRADEHKWNRGDPEKRARAEATVGLLRKSVGALREQADSCRRRGDEPGTVKAEASLAAQTGWLVEAEKALAEFSG